MLLAFQYHGESIPLPTQSVLDWVGTDERRGDSVAYLVRPTSPTLHPILRGLIQRFGPRSVVANSIAARLHSTEGAVSSLARHDAEVLELVEGWETEGDARVQAFVERMRVSLRLSKEKHEAYEEHERRRFRT